jgi:hypothetical protein
MSKWEYDFERRRIGHWVHDLSYYNFVATWTPTKNILWTMYFSGHVL